MTVYLLKCLDKCYLTAYKKLYSGSIAHCLLSIVSFEQQIDT